MRESERGEGEVAKGKRGRATACGLCVCVFGVCMCVRGRESVCVKRVRDGRGV